MQTQNSREKPSHVRALNHTHPFLRYRTLVRARLSPLQDRSDYTRTATGSVEYCECDSVKISDSPCDYGNGRWVLTFFWLASGTWGVAVLKNVVTATVTGSVASWWFSPADVGAVNGALYRATHGSFG